MSWDIDDGATTYTYDSVIDGTLITPKVNTAQTLTIRDDVLAGSSTAIDQLLLWIRYSDHVHFGTKNDGTPWYHENPPTTGANTNFVLITPPASVEVDPFYAVIEDGTDQTPGYGNPRIVETNVVWLAKESDYADRASAIADLEA